MTNEGIPLRKPNKLWVIQPDRSDPLPMVFTSRREETVLTRLHIGHSYLTHSFLLKEEEEKPVCIGSDEDLAIEHILFIAEISMTSEEDITLLKTSKSCSGMFLPTRFLTF